MVHTLMYLIFNKDLLLFFLESELVEKNIFLEVNSDFVVVFLYVIIFGGKIKKNST